jgi:hypothetical protein
MYLNEPLTPLQLDLPEEHLSRGAEDIISISDFVLDIGARIAGRVRQIGQSENRLTLLDVGCGRGVTIVDAAIRAREELRKKHDSGHLVEVEAIGLDLNPIPNRSLNIPPSVKFISGDATTLEQIPDNSVDVGWGFEVLLYFFS